MLAGATSLASLAIVYKTHEGVVESSVPDYTTHSNDMSVGIAVISFHP